jgi:hypothetical protein
MKMDKDLVRLILMETASRGHDPHDTISDFAIDGTPEIELSYHIWLLRDAGYLVAENLPTDQEGDVWLPKVLTYEGQQFLAAVEDAEVWRQTKELARKGGVEGIKLIRKIALKVVMNEFTKRTGIDLE